MIAVLLLLPGCVRLPDHCVVDRAPGGDIRQFAERDMQGRQLDLETLYFAVLGDPVATRKHFYDGGEWIASAYDDDLSDTDPTTETFVTRDAEGRVERIEVVEKPSDVLQEQHDFTWETDRVATARHVTSFATWDEEWSWDGDRAVVRQIYDNDRIITQIRTYAPSPLDWPVLVLDADLPGLAFLSIGIDDDESGTIEEVERVRVREVDANGIPIYSRLYDPSGSLITQTDWGACPTLEE